MALFLISTAIRPTEMTRVKLDMVVIGSDGSVTVNLPKQITKTCVARQVYLNPDPAAALKAWLSFRSKVRFQSDDQDFLFPTSREGRPGNQQIDSNDLARSFRRIVEYGKRKGYIPSDTILTMYCFKDYAITRLHEVNVEAAARIAWGAKPRSTSVASRYDRLRSAADIANLNEAQQEAMTRQALQRSGLGQGFTHVRI